MENTEKIKKYAGGEIHKTADGYYVFVKDDGSHCGPYVSISSLKGAMAEVEPTEVETGAKVEVAGGAEVEPTEVETGATKSGKSGK